MLHCKCCSNVFSECMSTDFNENFLVSIRHHFFSDEGYDLIYDENEKIADVEQCSYFKKEFTNQKINCKFYLLAKKQLVFDYYKKKC